MGTTRDGKPGVKVVRRTLADGRVKEYRYARDEKKPRKPEGDLRWLFNEYSESPEFKRLVPHWRERKLWLFREIERELGWMSLADLEDRRARADFYALRDKHAGLPNRADQMMRALASTLAWAYDRGMIGSNQAQRMKPLVDWTRSPHQDKCFTEEQEEVLVTSLPDDLRRLYLFAVYTGMRRGDIAALPRTALKRDGWLVWTPAKTSRKTGVEVHLPTFALPPLAEVIAEMPKEGPMLLATDRGLAWSEFNISHRWRRAMAPLGFQGMRFHDVRHTTENRLRAAGCTEAESGVITGRALASGSARLYVARTRELALNAYAKLWRYLEGKNRVVPFERFPAVSGEAG
jgi:integrase